MSFADATAVEQLSERTWTGHIAPGWSIFENANGGYLMAMVARAMSESVDGRLPASVTAHFTRPGKPGPVTIEVEALRSGRTFSTVRANLSTDDRLILSALGSFSDRGREPKPSTFVDGSAPDLPPPDECVLMVPSTTGPLPPPLMGKVEERLHPDDAAALEGNRTGVARVRGWIRLKDEEPLDTFALLMAADAFPPAVFNTNIPLAWTPTLELTTHVRGSEVGGWLRCQFSTRFVTGGYLEEDGEVWDADGSLLAQSRQLALVPSG